MSETAKSTAGEMTRRCILETGVRLWRVDPQYVTARRIATELNLTHGAVIYHFSRGQRLRDAVAQHAVNEGDARVIASLIAMQHKAAASLTEVQRLEFMRLAATAS